MTTDIVKIQSEIKGELAKKEVMNALVATTFKGLATPQIYLAIQEGMMRGFNFENFLKKDIYAIPFKSGYSLVTSIDYARKLGMKGGVVGTSKPEYEMGGEKGDKIVSCTITVQKKTGDHIGDFAATAYFSEYFKAGYNGKPSLWETKPRTMIAKVAEMHALRKACPEEMAQVYAEEEMQQSDGVVVIDDQWREEIDAIKTVEELKAYYTANKGRGKDFDKYVTKRKLELQNEEVKA